MSTDYENFFAGTLCRKIIAATLSLNIPPRLNCVGASLHLILAGYLRSASLQTFRKTCRW